jgi:uncharacterized repeat protein (TIGR04052 family)
LLPEITMFLRVLSLAAALALSASSTFAQDSVQPVRLRFSATVGGDPAACGASYKDIGTTRSEISFVDFRFYVSNVRLLTADGGEQRVTLTQDGLWQLDDVALLDFENGTAACSNGTEQTRDMIEGRVPAGRYVGLRFDLGLPFDKNHQDPTLQPSPLNLSRMFWSWNAGYKFMRMDLRTTGQPKGWTLHLGSTGCLPAGQPTTVPASCARPNVATIEFRDFDPASDVVELDVKRLLATSNVDVNTPETAAGCMSGPSDPECAPLLAQFGLPLAADQPVTQSVFRARRAATVAAPRQ